MKQRRVAIFLNDMHVAGGIQRVAANLVRDLGQHYQTLLLTVEPLREPVFQAPGLEFRSLDIQRRAVARVSYLLELARVGASLRRFVRDEGIDTLIAIWYDWAVVAALALPDTVKKIGCEHISYWEAARFWQLMRRISYPRLDAVVGLTQEDLPLLANISRHAQVIPNAVPLSPPASMETREKILLTAGHLISRKGIDRLLWALKLPLHAHPDWKLVVLGGGEKGHVDWGYLDYVATLLKLLQLEGRVEFHPATRHIGDWYRRASVYVMGSRQEGLPLVLIEAKAHGLPIVSFDCPTGPKEIVRHQLDGFLIQDDSHEFGEAVASLMTDPGLWRRMSAAALADARARFSVEAVTHQWSELIEAIHRGQPLLPAR